MAREGSRARPAALEPIAVRLAGGEVLLDFGVGDDALLYGVDEEHAAGLEAALFADVFSGDVENAGFGSKHNKVVFGDDVAAGAQTVAVECGADNASIGEGDGGGTVPR